MFTSAEQLAELAGRETPEVLAMLIEYSWPSREHELNAPCLPSIPEHELDAPCLPWPSCSEHELEVLNMKVGAGWTVSSKTLVTG